METLILGILILAGIIGGLLLFRTISEWLEESTGRDVSGWVGSIFGALLFALIASGGLWCIFFGMESDNVLAVIFGLVVCGFGLTGVYISLVHD